MTSNVGSLSVLASIYLLPLFQFLNNQLLPQGCQYRPDERMIRQ
jgi:hypothetical protein